MLRRRLNATTADDTWADTALNTIINEALRLIQDELLKVDPHHLIYDYTTAIVSAQDLYARPAGLRTETGLFIKVTSGGTFKRVALAKGLDLERTNAVGSSAVVADEMSGYEYARDGSYFRLAPIPTFSLAAALKITGVPLIAVSSDSDTPDLEVGLHLAAVYQAHLIAGGGAGDDAKATRDDLDRVLANIPFVYRRTASGPMLFAPEITKDY